MIDARSTSPPEPRPSPEWRVREADGEADAFALDRFWAPYFGKYVPGELPFELFDVADWSHNDVEIPPAYGVIAEHVRGDQAVLVGGGLVAIYDHDSLVEELDPLPDPGFDPGALAGERNAWLVFGIVDAAWRGRGIGHRLFDMRLSWARDQDADMVFGFGWERDDRPTSRPLFEQHDFIPLGRHPYLDRDVCPDCGVWGSDDATCNCEFTLWARDPNSESQ